MTSRRPHIPMKVQRDAAIYQLGLDPETAELDHHPALARRERKPDGSYDPPFASPQHLFWRSPGAHREKTYGRRGEKRVTSYGSDIHEIAKTRRIAKEPEKWRDLTGPKRPKEARRKHRIASRPFAKGHRPLRARNNLRRGNNGNDQR